MASVIETSWISQVYGSGSDQLRVLDVENLSIQEGEFVSVLGPSGCGKSTLLKLIAGLNLPSGGEIRVDGQPVRKPVTSLGMVFQQDLLLSWRTILDNLMLQAEIRRLPAREYARRAMELLSLVGLDGFADKLPGQLSGGMRQRAAICRALLHDPSIMLMDEPFGALDAMTRDQMNIELLKIWSGTRKTVVFVTHSIQEAVFLSDRVLVMTPRPGRIAHDIAVELPRPRRLAVRETPEFLRYEAELQRIFEGYGIIHEDLP